ncbi:MAG: DivIVA domain-containing protein [Candidatus Aminicenantes bacterium]|nr:MAG: DivIVA domain-containing protein [Candidatus Aminicenantes bacterium]
MKLTPQDILGQQFSVKMKGYDKEEVNHFLMQIAEMLESEILQREQLKKEFDKVKENLAKFEKREDILRDTLISAQKFSHEIKLNSEREAELVIKEAEIKAESIVDNAISRQREIKEEIRNLKFKRIEMENDIINMLTSLKELIETYRKEDEDFEKIEYLAK